MSIRKRTNRSGKAVYSVIFENGTCDGKRTRSCKTYKTLREAKAAEAKALATRDALKEGSGNLTLEAYIENSYWPNAEKRLAASSLDTYQIEIRKRIVPELGEKRLVEIDRPMVQKMIHKCKTRSVGSKCLGVIRAILNEAVADGLLITNPAAKRITLPKGGSKRDNGLVLGSYDQIAGLVDIVSHKANKTVLRMVYLGLLQGLRPEERYALQWDDIDMEERTITIRSAYVAVSKAHGGNQAKAPKTEKSNRTIPMHPKLYAYILSQERKEGAFVTDGKMLSPSTARHRWDRFLAENPEVPRITLENMRHSFATAYLESGGRIETLSRILGHSSIETTLKRYVRPDIESIKADFEIVAKNGQKKSRHPSS